MVSMAYNADQQRAAKQSTDGAVTGFLYDYKRLLCETDTVGGAISQTYASDTTEEFGDLIGEDGQYIHQYDAQATTNALLDETGTVQAQYKYYAFGQVSAVSTDGGSWTAEDWQSLPLDFTSNMLAGSKKQYYLDQEIALYLLGSGNNGRYYDAATGRFLSEDPTGEAGGDANLFRYTGNDPVNNLDPSGHQDWNPEEEEDETGGAHGMVPSEGKEAESYKEESLAHGDWAPGGETWTQAQEEQLRGAAKELGQAMKDPGSLTPEARQDLDKAKLNLERAQQGLAQKRSIFSSQKQRSEARKFTDLAEEHASEEMRKAQESEAKAAANKGSTASDEQRGKASQRGKQAPKSGKPKTYQTYTKKMNKPARFIPVRQVERENPKKMSLVEIRITT